MQKERFCLHGSPYTNVNFRKNEGPMIHFSFDDPGVAIIFTLLIILLLQSIAIIIIIKKKHNPPSDIDTAIESIFRERRQNSAPSYEARGILKKRTKR